MMDFKDFCEFLSDYFDHELESDMCAEIDELVCDDCFCKAMFDTFDKTLDLCRQIEEEMMEVPEDVHIHLCEILKIEIRKKQDF